MERTPEHIDDLFRKRLRGAAPPPPAFVWDNVERELRKRRKRFIFWIFSTGITALGLLGAWIALTLQPGNNFSSVPTTHSPSTDYTKQVATLPVEHQLSTVSAPAGTETTTTLTLPIKANTTLSKGISAADKPGTPMYQVTEAVGFPDLITAQLITETTPPSLEATPQKTILEDPDVDMGIVSIVPLRPLVPLAPIFNHIRTSEWLKKTWPVVLKTRASKPVAKKAVKNCYDFAKQPQAWLLEAYVGPSLAQRELISSPDDRPYLNKRLSTEHRNLAFNAGLRASLMLKGNFLIRSGVHYDQMTEVFEYIDPEYKRTIVSFEEHPDGTITIDTVGVEYGEKYQKTFNRFGMLDIPVLAGVELRKGRSGFNINAGMSFNVLFWKRGAIVSPESGGPAWFTPGKKDAIEVFRPRTGLSATASVQWFYHVNPRLRVFVEPYFKKVLRPVSLSSHPVEQRYGIGGIHFGLTKILN